MRRREVHVTAAGGGDAVAGVDTNVLERIRVLEAPFARQVDARPVDRRQIHGQAAAFEDAKIDRRRSQVE